MIKKNNAVILYSILFLLLMQFEVFAQKSQENDGQITVYAASSLTNALQDIAEIYQKKSGKKIRFSFAASSALARQIEAGAPADIFFSADEDWVDYLQERALVQPQNRRALLSNRLVLIAQKESKVALKLQPNAPLLQALGNGRLAMADPDFVPAGRYAKQALTSLQIWPQVAGKLARAENVRAALSFVARAEAPLGIVYATDAFLDKRVRIIDFFPETSHEKILYTAVVIPRTAHKEVLDFFNFLRSAEAREIYQKYKFTIL
jgi:molybdate transport system substrate-binding protein